MNKNKLLSVSEFAKRVERSEKTIYKAMTGKLSPYVKKIDGRKWIQSEGLNLFTVQAENNKMQDPELEVLQETIEILKNQMHIKDQQIKEKDKQLERFDLALTEYRQLFRKWFEGNQND